jgi:1-acyl-sn-glycerol-3-phosphate acyltransferase
LARKMGSVPASQDNAHRLLERGLPLLVYPGGESEAYRPWTARNQIDLQRHTGFVRLALRHQVPVFPMVAHGSHDAIVVLSRGEDIARVFGLDRLRSDVLPIVAGPPWGVAPFFLPTFPMPTKVTVRVCEPVDWSRLGPETADDPEVVSLCYEEVLGRMQANLDELSSELPHPVAARIRSALGLDRLRRSRDRE